MNRLILVLILMAASVIAAPDAPETHRGRVLVVDNRHPAASDTNSGSASAPLVGFRALVVHDPGIAPF
jgi:hypothetical protein